MNSNNNVVKFTIRNSDLFYLSNKSIDEIHKGYINSCAKLGVIFDSEKNYTDYDIDDVEYIYRLIHTRNQEGRYISYNILTESLFKIYDITLCELYDSTTFINDLMLPFIRISIPDFEMCKINVFQSNLNDFDIQDYNKFGENWYMQ